VDNTRIEIKVDSQSCQLADVEIEQITSRCIVALCSVKMLFVQSEFTELWKLPFSPISVHFALFRCTEAYENCTKYFRHFFIKTDISALIRPTSHHCNILVRPIIS